MVALALLDFAPVFFLSLGLFFLAQLVDRLDPRCRRMAIAGFALVTLGGLARATSNVSLAFSGREIPFLTACLYVFAGPGFILMSAALIRGRATLAGRQVRRDPWLGPAVVSWTFLAVAFYLSGAGEDGPWRLVLVALALIGCASIGLVTAILGWARQLHMAAALLAFQAGATWIFLGLRIWAPQSVIVQILGELLNLAAQAAFAFASWRVAAEYQARVGPIAGA